MKTEINGANKIFLGTRKEDDAKIYMSKPSWDCEWYWAFGYLGNRNEHYHLSSYQTKDLRLKDEQGQYRFFNQLRNMNMYDCLLLDYKLNFDEKFLWSFCEQAQTIYALKEAYEVMYRGGSNYTTHPLQEIIKNREEALKLAELLQVLLQKFWDDLTVWTTEIES